MKKMLLICGALLAFSATAALAQVTAPGLYLNWGNCIGDGPVVASKTSACTSTAGSNTMVLSWVPSHDVALYNGAEAFVNFSFQGGVLPAWWGNACTGRAGTFGGQSANVTVNPSALNCADIWASLALGGIAAYNQNQAGPGTSQLDVAAAVATGNEMQPTVGQEYFLFNISFSNLKNRVADGCTGCLVPACINFHELRYTEPAPAPQVTILDNEGALANHWIYWQAPNADVAACRAASATHQSSWGSVKALYR